jgi:hypothetical protein
MKSKLITVLLTTVVLLTVSVLATAQNANEKALKQTERVRKDVAKVGTGTRSEVEVDLLDGKKYSGYVSEANDKSFVVIDKQNRSNAINYSDVRKVRDKNGNGGGKTVLYALVGVGAGVLAWFLIRAATVGSPR